MEPVGLIPARGNSRRILRKNLRLIDGQPLVVRAIETLLGVTEQVFVSTNDRTIAALAEIHGATSILTDDEYPMIHSDESTIADVIAHALPHMPVSKAGLVVIQPTSPFLTAHTINEALRQFAKGSLISVVDSPHNYYRDGKPLYHDRLNRQPNEGIERESGALRIFGEAVDVYANPTQLFPISAREGFEIDEPQDLWGARKPKNILFNVSAGGYRIGYGHIKRALTLADELQGHDVRFQDRGPEVQRLVTEAGHQLRERGDTFFPHLYIYDDLGTSWVPPMIFTPTLSFEDDTGIHGPTINSMLGDGGGWAVLGPEYAYLPTRILNDEVTTISLLFGGEDRWGFSDKVAPPLRHWFGDRIIREISPKDDPVILEEMWKTDLLITSGGRTVFEAAATGTPVMVLTQNMREESHQHFDHALYVGSGRLFDQRALINAVKHVIYDHRLRQEAVDLGYKLVDGKGTQRVVNRIEKMLV